MGATIGECGARKWTPLATATLLIGANLPDVDALSYVFGSNVTALGFRRGWTHGILAVLVWPLLLAGAMWLYDSMVRLRRPGTGGNQAKFGPLLLLAFLAVLSHPLLDFLNTYGVRFLMPFSGRWFYGDTLFIVDPWVWIVLAAGIVAGRMSRTVTAPRIAAGVALAYVVAMGVSGAWARHQVREYAEGGAIGMPAVRVMAAPVPLDPSRRDILVATAGGYAEAAWSFLRSPHLGPQWRTTLSDSLGPTQRAAVRTAAGRTYLSWSRFPVFVAGGRDGCPSGDVCIRDARYYGQRWAEVAIPVVSPVSSSPSPDP